MKPKALGPRRQIRSFALSISFAGAVATAPTAFATNATWNVNAAGSTSWLTGTNWTPQTVPNAAGDVANVTFNISGLPTTITLDGTITLGQLTIGDANNSQPYTIATGTGGSFVFDTGTASNATLTDLATGGITGIPDTISANIQLNNSLDVTANSTANTQGFLLSGNISEGSAGKSLNKLGVGKLTLTGTNTYTGATTISAGTVQFTKTAALYNSATGSWVASNIKVSNGGTLALNVGGAGEFSTGNVTTLLTNLGGANGGTSGGLASGATIAFDTTNSGGTFTVADNIANSSGVGGGAIGLSKLGTNTLILTGSNTYTGATTVSAGTLQIGSGGTTGSLSTSSAIVDNGTLTFNRSDAVTQGTHFSSAAITGTGGIIQQGGGVLTLSASNAYTGTTVVNGGSVTVSNSNGLGTGGAVTVGGGQFLTLSGGVNVSGHQITISNTGSLGGLRASGSGTINTWTGNVVLGNNGTRIGVDDNVTLVIDGVVSGASNGLTVRNNSGSGTVVLKQAATYGNTTSILNGTLRIMGSDLLPTGQLLQMGAFGIGLATLDLNGNNQTVTGLNCSQDPSTIDIVSAGGSSTFTITNTGSNSFNGTIKNTTGTVSLVKTGTGTQVLAGANTHTGGTTVNQGTLTVSGASATLGGSTGALVVSNTNSTAAATNTVVNLSATLDTTTGSLSGSIATPTSGINTATLNNGGAGRNFTVNQTSAGNYAGVIAGAGSFTLGGSSNNTLTFSGANSYSGGTTIAGGTLAISGSGKLGATTNALTMGGGALNLGTTTQTAASASITTAAASGDTISNGTLTLTSTGNALAASNSTGTATVSANVNSSGILNMSGAGTLTLSGSNSFTQTVNTNNQGAVTVTSGTVNLTGNNTLSATGAANQSGNLLAVSGGVLNLTGTNVLSSVNMGGAIVVINGGKLTVSSFANNLNGATTINMGSSFLAQGDTVKYTGAGETTNISFGSTAGGANAQGTIDQSGTGLLKITGNYSGGGTTLVTLQGSTAGTGEFAGNILNTSNTTGLKKSGTGTWTLSGTNTYSGTTSVNAGKLVVSGSIANSAVTVTGTNTTLASGSTGSIGSSVTVNAGAILAAGDVNSVGTATVGSGGLDLKTTSIFDWELNANVDSTTGTRGTNYDGLTTTNGGNFTVASGAIFKVILTGAVDGSNAFWNTTRSWSNIFSIAGATAPAGANLFDTVQVLDSTTGALFTAANGSFSFTGSTLTWSAVPEPTSALSGLLVAAGILRRRRR